MGKIESFRITLTKPNPIYCSGEEMVGHVHLVILDRLKIKCIKLIVDGHAKASW